MKLCKECGSTVRIKKKDGKCPKCGAEIEVKLKKVGLRYKEEIEKTKIDEIKVIKIPKVENTPIYGPRRKITKGVKKPKQKKKVENYGFKIAICLSGQPRRKSKEVLKSLYENVIDEFNADVFISTSINSGDVVQIEVYNMLNEISKNGYPFKAIEIKEDFMIDMEDLPVFKYLNPWKEKDKYSGFTETQRILQQLYYIRRASELRRDYEERENVSYDCVIRARLDFGIFTKFNLPFEYFLSENKNSIYTRKKLNIFHDKSLIPTYDDIFVFGPSDPMTIYMERLNFYEELPSDYYNLFSTETHAEYICENKNIDIIEMDKSDFVEIHIPKK